MNAKDRSTNGTAAPPQPLTPDLPPEVEAPELRFTHGEPRTQTKDEREREERERSGGAGGGGATEPPD